MENKVSDFIDTMIEVNKIFDFNLNVEAPLQREEFQSLFLAHHKSFLPPEMYRKKDEEYVDALSRPFYWHYRIYLGLKESKRLGSNYGLRAVPAPPKAVNYSRPDLMFVS